MTPIDQRSPTIAVLGEAIVDFVPHGAAREGRREMPLRAVPGGSPLNTAVAASRLGQGVAALTQFSTDVFGELLVQHLHDNGVSTQWASRSDDPCALAFVIETPGGAQFTFRGQGSADVLWDPQPRPVLPDSMRFFQLSSLTSFLPPSADANHDILSAHSDRVTVLLDPTVRPALVPERSRWWAFLARFLPLAHIVKASDQDLEFLAPGVDPLHSAQRFVEMGASVVIVTFGGDGARLVRSAGAALEVIAPQVEVADTVGAGDTFAGALMTWLIEHGHQAPADLATRSDADWLAAMHFAATAAAITCTRPGADPPTRAELDQWLAADR